MAILLPRTSSKPENQDPRILVLMSNTKVGKTSHSLKLPNSLLVDLEDGSVYYEGVAINLKREALISGKGLGGLMLETAQAIREANQAEGKSIYDYIILDTLTVIEEIAKVKATLDYKSTLQGKNFTGKDVCKELPKGAGYAFLTAAFNDLIAPWKGLAGKCLVLLGHAKLSTIDKGATEVQVNDLELTGKNKIGIMANADSIGYLRRNKKNVNENILTFKTSESDLVCGSRSPHLRNKEFIFSTYKPETNILTVNWDLVFTSLRTKSTPQMVEIIDEPTIDNEEHITPETNNSNKIPV